MAVGIIGRKCGMTRVFDEDGASIPVTVIHASPNRITQIKDVETDGYNSLQVTTGDVKQSRVSKADAGQFIKAGVDAGRGKWEFKLDSGVETYEVGSAITVETFSSGQKVDVTGVSKGGILECKMPLMVTHCLTALMDLSVKIRPQVVFSKVKR